MGMFVGMHLIVGGYVPCSRVRLPWVEPDLPRKVSNQQIDVSLPLRSSSKGSGAFMNSGVTWYTGKSSVFTTPYAFHPTIPLFFIGSPSLQQYCLLIEPSRFRHETRVCQVRIELST